MINEFLGDGTSQVVKWTGRNFRPIQTGRIQQYMMLSLVVHGGGCRRAARITST